MPGASAGPLSGARRRNGPRGGSRVADRCSWGASPRTKGRKRLPRSDPCAGGNAAAGQGFDRRLPGKDSPATPDSGTGIAANSGGSRSHEPGASSGGTREDPGWRKPVRPVGAVDRRRIEPESNENRRRTFGRGGRRRTDGGRGSTGGWERQARDVGHKKGTCLAGRCRRMVKWSPKVGQVGSLTQSPKHDPHVQETTSAQSRSESEGRS